MYSNDLHAQLAKSPIVKKLRNYLILLILAELGIFILLCFLTSLGITIAITIGFIFIGYSIKPMDAPKLTQQGMPSASMLNDFKQVRNIVGILFMIPGFLTTILGILFLIPLTRKALFALGKKIADRIIKQMTGGLGLDQFRKMGMGNGFGGMGNGCSTQTGTSSSKGPTSAQAAAEAARRSKRQRHKQHETVDVDYEIRDEDGVWIGGKADAPTDLVVAMKHAKRPQKAESDVIDVEAEWK